MGVHVMTIDDFRGVLEDVLDQSGLAIVAETTAADIEGWDSLNHARLLLRIEQRFGIDLPTGDIGDAENVGELLTIVNRALSTAAAASGAGAASRRNISFPPLRRNEHQTKLTEFFGPFKREDVKIPDSTSFVFVCFSNRADSNFLAELLASSGQYNRAGEFLTWGGIVSFAKRRKLKSFQEAFAQLVARFQKADRFICRTALAHLEPLVRSGVLDQIIDRSRFVLVERSDTLAQAISNALARATGSDTPNQKTSAGARAIRYSREKVDRCLDTIASVLATAAHDYAVFFGRNGIIPVRVSCERLIADPEAESRWLARELGLKDFRIKLDKVSLADQAGAIQAEWRQRYLSENPLEGSHR